MRIEYTEDQQALRREFRTYLEGVMTPEIRAQTASRESGETFRAVIRQMGRDGWLTPGWPVEYGGRGLSPIAQKIVLEELWRAEAPFPFVTVNTVGPCLMRLGTEQQKREILPKIASGELIFAIGYTEPQAGTDLAALRTRAVLKGDHFVINGSKIYTSGAEGADYVWLAARTDAEAPPHKGITIMMLDVREPGFSLSPIHTVGGVRTNVTYYEDVRVPLDMVVGEINGGWKLIIEQLNHERIGLGALSYGGQVCFDEVLEWARSDAADSAIEEPWVQANLAEAYALLQASMVMGDRIAYEVDKGRITGELASGAKVYGTESLIQVYRLLMEVVGPQAQLRSGSPGAVLHGRLEEEYRRCQINTFGGGVNEVLRDMIATTGLHMPRAAR